MVRINLLTLLTKRPGCNAYVQSVLKFSPSLPEVTMVREAGRE